MKKKSREIFEYANGVPSLDYLHRIAQSGKGLTGLLNAMPNASPDELRYWLETNRYKVE